MIFFIHIRPGTSEACPSVFFTIKTTTFRGLSSCLFFTILKVARIVQYGKQRPSELRHYRYSSRDTLRFLLLVRTFSLQLLRKLTSSRFKHALTVAVRVLVISKASLSSLRTCISPVFVSAKIRIRKDLPFLHICMCKESKPFLLYMFCNTIVKLFNHSYASVSWFSDLLPWYYKFVYPMRLSSTARATFLPSAMAHTTRDCPLLTSPAANTTGWLVR